MNNGSPEQPQLSRQDRVKASFRTLRTDILSYRGGLPVIGPIAFGAEQFAQLNEAPIWARVLAGVGGGLAAGTPMFRDLVQSWRTGVPRVPQKLGE